MHRVFDQLVPVVRKRPETNLEKVACESQRAFLSVLCECVLEFLWKHRPVQAGLDVVDDMVSVVERFLVLEVVDAVVPVCNMIQLSTNSSRPALAKDNQLYQTYSDCLKLT